QFQDTLCGFGETIVPGTIVPPLINWLKDQSTAGSFDYHIAGSPIEFETGPMLIDSAACALLDTTYNELMNNGTLGRLRGYLNDITTNCKGNGPQNEELNTKYFLIYFAEVGYQHVYPYVEEFIPEGLQVAVNSYSVGGTTSTDGVEWEESLTLTDLLEKVKDSKQCDCP
ncbi:MAG: hypothetical protein AAF206_08635, partial [Bacteroidota bacterium]